MKIALLDLEFNCRHRGFEGVLLSLMTGISAELLFGYRRMGFYATVGLRLSPDQGGDQRGNFPHPWVAQGVPCVLRREDAERALRKDKSLSYLHSWITRRRPQMMIECVTE
jgi:hypothetical protein